MHRSGTSLFANYLMKCGLDLGDNLLQPDKGNPSGYFEDKDFLSLHNKILKSNGCHYFFNLRTKPSLTIKKKYKAEAKAILSRKINNKKKWGWKDPRTSLFLDFWDNLLNIEVNYIFLIRHPLAVYDSLIRRGTDSIINKGPITGLKTWIIYNKQLLDFYHKKKKNNVTFIEIDSFLNNETWYRNLLSEKIGINIGAEAGAVIDKNKIKGKQDLKGNRLIKLRYPLLYLKAIYMYNQMQKYEASV